MHMLHEGECVETVSVIIATYRRNETLKRAIESVLNQTYNDIELIVVDDNADAEWNTEVSNIVNIHPAVKYIQNKENKGSAKTRNIGISEAEGEFITFLDDDDIYLSEKIEHQLNDMIKHNADFSVTDLLLYNERDKLIDKRIRSYITDYSPEQLLKNHLMHHITGTDTLMFKKSYLEKIGGFPPINVGDEFYLMKEAICGGGKLIYTKGCYVKAYVHSETDGLSSNMSKINGENALYEYKKTMFGSLDKKSVRYIKMRHHAVLAFAYLRMNKYGKFILQAAKSFFCSPLSSVMLLLDLQ
jgi:glycosyltransferase involved in cell wall biosynthesis